MAPCGVPALVPLVTGWLLGLLASALRHTHARGGDASLSVAAGLVLSAAAIVLATWCARRVWRSSNARSNGTSTTIGAVVLSCAGLLVGDAAWRHDAACRAALLVSAAPYLVRLDTPAAPGAWVRGDARLARGRSTLVHTCRVPVTIAVESGTAPAGAWVHITARLLPAARGVRLDAAALTPRGAVDRVHAWRATSGARIDTLFGARAPLVRALLVADQTGIDHTVRDRYADAGLVHLLSVSGLHVAIIATALRTLGAALRVRRSIGDAIAVFGVVSYVLLLGWPAPAVRAAMMLFTVTLSARLGRPVHSWTALALGVVLPTVQPTVIADLGWQLSAGGMAGLVAARTLLRRWRAVPLVMPAPPVCDRDAPWSARVRCATARWGRRVRLIGPRLRGWRLTLTQELLVGVIASLVSAPLIAWTFGRVSLIAPLANLFAAPAVTLLQPTLFLALVLDLLGGPFAALAPWVADAAIAPIVALDVVASLGGRVPFAAIAVAPDLLSAICLGIAAAALVVATAARRPWPPLLTGGAAMVMALWWPLVARGPGRAEVHVLDVGQGDALAIRTPRGRWVLIDAGRVWRGGDAGRRVVVPWVRRRGGDVALFVLTHPDADHVGGAPSVLAALQPQFWWDPGFVHGSDVYRDALRQAAVHDIPWRRARVGDSLRIDGVLLRVLGPDSAWTAAQRSANDASTILLVEHGRVRFLLTGDAEAAQEAWLLERWGSGLGATVLKVGHHGSRTSSTPAFLDAVRPTLAVISVGADNRYGHPAPDVMRALRDRGADILRTDRDGPVIFRSDGRRLEVETARARWAVDVP